MRIRLFSIACVLALVASAYADVAPDVSAKNWKRTRKHVLPDKADTQWRKVPWRATLWQAVIDAQREDKPILLWAMNGHALACT